MLMSEETPIAVVPIHFGCAGSSSKNSFSRSRESAMPNSVLHPPTTRKRIDCTFASRLPTLTITLQLLSCDALEINALFLRYQRPVLHDAVDRSHILADNSERNQLNRTEKEQPDHGRRQPQFEVVPE